MHHPQWFILTCDKPAGAGPGSTFFLPVFLGFSEFLLGVEPLLLGRASLVEGRNTPDPLWK